MKHMSLKEFRENLKGTKFENHNLEDILNCLSILCDFNAEKENKFGCVSLAEYSKESSNLIYDRLNKLGYYDTDK